MTQESLVKHSNVFFSLELFKNMSKYLLQNRWHFSQTKSGRISLLTKCQIAFQKDDGHCQAHPPSFDQRLDRRRQ